MDKKEILTSLQDLLDDNYIYEKAVELQAINPAAFGRLIATLIEEQTFTEERFEELYEELYEDKLDVITQYQYFASRTLVSNKDTDGCAFDGAEYVEEIFEEDL